MSDTKPLRSFGLLVGGIFALISVWPAIGRGQPPRLWSLILGGMLIVLACVRPQGLAQVYRLWMTMGEILGWINTRILLGLIFYGIFTPLGLLMRLRGKDPMRRTLTPEADTYRVVRQPRPSSHMQHQF
jgi:hypothetical protein